jgi:AraC-like DNA-binding protein
MVRIGTSARLGKVTLSGLTRRAGSTGTPAMRIFGSYALVYMLSGRAFYQDANGVDMFLRPGDIILVFPELGHRYGPVPGDSWSEYYLCFEGPVFDLWRKAGFLDSGRPVHHVEPVEHWLKRFQSVLGGDRRPGPAPAILEVCRLQQVLAEAFLAEETGTLSPRDLDWVARACRLLEGEADQDTPMPAIAKKLGDSYESFRKKFTHLVGVPPARYRDARVIDRGRRLMQETNLRNKEIADRLGFCDEFHFSHRFKQITGKSPKEFRQTLPTKGN